MLDSISWGIFVGMVSSEDSLRLVLNPGPTVLPCSVRLLYACSTMQAECKPISSLVSTKLEDKLISPAQLP